MGEQPRDSGTIQPVSWQRAIWPLVVVLVLATLVCRRDLNLSWPGTALVLVVIVATTILWWRFATHKVCLGPRGGAARGKRDPAG